MAKKYRIKRTLNIGSPDAETDDILFDVFVENDTLEEVLNTRSQKSILLGRTGSGKSAVIKYLEKNCSDVTRIEPEAMSLQFLSNSTILIYFRSLDINLNLFFKVLWKHVFIVELLKLYFKNDFNQEKKGRWMMELKSTLLKKVSKKDPNKIRALEYLERWTDKFWLDTEYRIKELEKTISDKFKAGLGIKSSVINSQAEYESLVGQKSIAEIKNKAESVIHESLSKDLLQIFSIMKCELFNQHQKKFYLVIDDLDKEWIESKFRYDLIDAMVEVIKEFRQFNGVKIVISLRENLTELLNLGSTHEGGQREKFKPLYANMQWEKEDLIKLINNRLKTITENQLDIKQAFYAMRRTNETGISYVLERTFMRPRDIISFVNHAIQNTNNKTQFTRDIIYKAEVPYSIDRFQALEDEWRENYGEIYPICRFLNSIQNGFKLRSLTEENFADIYLNEDADNRFKGVLFRSIQSWRNDQIKFNVFVKKIVYLLYHIGVIGIKKGPTFPTSFFYDDVSITREDISNNNKFYVHPSLYSYFKINVIDQMPEEN